MVSDDIERTIIGEKCTKTNMYSACKFLPNVDEIAEIIGINEELIKGGSTFRGRKKGIFCN